MAYTPNDNFRKAFSRGDVEPVIFAAIEVPPRLFFRVIDYTEGAGDEIEFPLHGSITLTEGTDFDAETSNAVTASNIVDAINSIASLRGITRARIADFDLSVVEIIPFEHDDEMTVECSDTAFADVEPYRRPQIVRWIDVVSNSIGSTTLTFSINASIPTVLTAGVSFSAGATREATATNIAAAINADGTLGPLLRAYAIGRRVVTEATSGIIYYYVVTSSNSAIFLAPSLFRHAAFFCSGTRNLFGYQPSIVSAEPIDESVDALTREHSVSTLSIRFVDDGNIRRLQKAYPLKGSRVRVWIGTPSLDPADFVTEQTFTVDEVVPDGNGSIILEASSGLAILRDTDITVAFRGTHPREAAQQILNAGYGSSANAQQWFDYTELAFDVDLTQSHWLVSRTRHQVPITSEEGFQEVDAAMTSPVKALDALNDMCNILGTTIVPQSDGTFSLRQYDYDAAPDHEWAAGPDTGYDVEPIRPKDVHDSVVTRAELSFVATETTTWAMEDPDAVAAFKYPYVSRIASDWLNCYVANSYAYAPSPFASRYYMNLIRSDTTYLSLTYPGVAGICGSGGWVAGAGTTASRDANRAPDSAEGRITYLRIQGRQSNASDEVLSDETEVIALDDSFVSYTPSSLADSTTPQANRDDTPEFNADLYDTGDTVTTFANSPGGAPWNVWFRVATTYSNSQYSIVNGRAGFDTTGPESPYTQWGCTNDTTRLYGWQAVDVTIAIAMMDRIIQRFRTAAPKIQVRANLSKMGVQLGDVVALTGDDIFLMYNVDGVENNTFWEVTRISKTFLSDNPGVEMELTFIRSDAVFVATPVYTAPNVTPAITIPTVELGDAEVIVDGSGNEVWIDSDGDTIMDTVVVRYV